MKIDWQMEDLRPGEHLCHIYQTAVEQRTVLGAFLMQGLATGERVLYLAESSPQTLLDYLGAAGFDSERCCTSGQLQVAQRAALGLTDFESSRLGARLRFRLRRSR